MTTMNTKRYSTSMTINGFWDSINILMSKFNVINKRLWSSKIVIKSSFMSEKENWRVPFVNLNKLENDEYYQFILSNSKNFCLTSESNGSTSIEIVILELLPKKFTDSKAFQLICLDRNNTVVTYYDITPLKNCNNLCPNFTYSLALETNEVILRINSDFSIKSAIWLRDTVIPQFIKWGINNTKNSSQICKDSLNLISGDKYYIKYNELKVKYGKEMVEIWPENTDPLKFVYEDVAIATYLLLIWENEEPQKKTFVDLGCGNGLLVYILTQEGHEGVGIDVRKRKIWDMYPKNIKLEEITIIPSDSNLFPNANWLIGNHSDELTPWIPIIATRSSYKCNFFVLPCCAYNFNGTKYQRKDSSKSQYTEYIEYIKMLSEQCGFNTSVDRLKIPSTKRICLVGRKRIYLEQDYPEICKKIQTLIDSTSENQTTQWVSDFKPRDAVEKVRNCTQIDKKVIDSVIKTISSHLLCDCDTKEWSLGKNIDINLLVSLLSSDTLKAMKSECGGLQTLLKNNNHIFRVQKGKVQLRYPRTLEEVKNSNTKSKIKVKVKPCWFVHNHPQGCPLSDAECSYIHKPLN